MAPLAFVTGYPGFIAKQVVARLVAPPVRARVLALVESAHLADAREHAQTLPPGAVEVLEGDVTSMHLGLAGQEYERARGAAHIFHLAAVSAFEASAQLTHRVNVEGTRTVLELAQECPQLERLVHFSSCYVAGTRVGVIAEDELEARQIFRNAYEESKYEAERLVERAKGRLPVTIVRPATVVGDSRTGEIDRFEGPYSLGMLLVLSPLVLPLPLPGDGVAPLNVAPVDFVADATVALARNPKARGKTVHLVDPNPMSARRVYELIASRAHKRLPRFSLSPQLAELFLRLPGVEKLTRPQRVAISYVNHLALYSCRTASELLADSGLRCPPLEGYLDRLIDYALATWRARRDDDQAGNDDPLDRPLR